MSHCIFNIYSQQLNANDDTKKTATISIQKNDSFGFYVKSVSGSHTNHIIKAQSSFDKINWFDVESATITGLGITDNHSTCAGWLRLIVDTAQGSASQVRVYINAK